MRAKGKPLKTAENLFTPQYTGLKAAVLMKADVIMKNQVLQVEAPRCPRSAAVHRRLRGCFINFCPARAFPISR
jgi:hypothetical protein